jgi:tetratricopeptide (TPR) repeat protein
MQDEISWFRERARPIFLVLSSGGPHLARDILPSLADPLVLDFTTWRRGWPFRDHTELLRIVAPLLDCSYAELRQREVARTGRREAGIASAAALLAISTAFSAVNWVRAVQQKRIAEARLSDVLSIGRLVFSVADEERKQVHGAAGIRQHLTQAAGEMIQRLLTDAQAANDRDVLRVKSLGHTAAGDRLWTRGETEGAIAEYKAALDLDTRLLRMDPRGSERHADLALSYAKLSRIFALREDVENLRTHAEGAYQHASVSLQASPADAYRIHALAAANRDLATLAFLSRDWATARRRLDERLRLAGKAAQLEPNDARFVLTPVSVLLERSQLEKARGDLVAALDAARQAVDAHRGLLARFPNNPEVVRASFMSSLALGELLASDGAVESALAQMHKARKLAEDHLARQSADSETRVLLGLVEFRIAMIHLEAGRDDAGASSVLRACHLTQGSNDTRALRVQEICGQARRPSPR